MVRCRVRGTMKVSHPLCHTSNDTPLPLPASSAFRLTTAESSVHLTYMSNPNGYGKCGRTECGRNLPPPKATGRPRQYCSEECKQIVSLIRRSATHRTYKQPIRKIVVEGK